MICSREVVHAEFHSKMKVQKGELSDFYKITFGNASKNSSADKTVTVSNCHSRMKIFVLHNKGTKLASK